MPSMIYSIWLFKSDPVFKYWSLQGYNIGLLPLPHMHLLSYGVFTILFLLRLFTINANPLSGSERFILVCFAAIFILTHIGHIIPSLGFSPQIGVPLFSFISILAFSYVFSSTQKQKKIIVPIIILAVVLGGYGITYYFTQKFSNKHLTSFYLGNKDVEGFEWLKDKVTKNDVLLSSPDIANRLAKYTDAQVVAGHHSVTPEYKKEKEKIHYLFSQNIIKKQLIDSLFDNRVSYVYISKNDSIFNKEISFNGLVKVYENEAVEIYQNVIGPTVSWD